jgi:predicted transcriptional regulator
MATIKERVHQLADQLPPGATLEDAIERLVFEAKIDRGLAQVAAGQTVSHEEARRRLGQ